MRVADGVQTAQKSLTITISTALVVATVSLPNGVQGTGYSETLTATGGTVQHMVAGNGDITCGSESIRSRRDQRDTDRNRAVDVHCTGDRWRADGREISDDYRQRGLTIMTTSLPDAVQGIAYSRTLAATGGTGTNTWSLATGSLPTGLTLSAAGVISGTRTATGTRSPCR